MTAGGGEYRIVNLDPNWTSFGEQLIVRFLPYSRLAVDVHFASAEAGQVAYVGCRRSNPQLQGYRLCLDAGGQRARLERLENSRVVPLGHWSAAPTADTYHLELRCAAGTVSGTVNNVVVGSADSSRDGRALQQSGDQPGVAGLAACTGHPA